MIIILIILIVVYIKSLYNRYIGYNPIPNKLKNPFKIKAVKKKKSHGDIDYKSQIKKYLQQQETLNYLDNNISLENYYKPKYPFIQTL
jgi:hypothetical protein